MLTTLIICSMLTCNQVQDTNVLSLKEASEFYNGKAVPDSNLLHYLEFSSFIDILKITEDSLKIKMVIGIDKNLNFVLKSKHLSHEQLIKEILTSKNRNVYVYNCIEMIKTQVNYGLINKISTDDMAQYLGILSLNEYREVRKQLFDF